MPVQLAWHRSPHRRLAMHTAVDTITCYTQKILTQAFSLLMSGVARRARDEVQQICLVSQLYVFIKSEHWTL